MWRTLDGLDGRDGGATVDQARNRRRRVVHRSGRVISGTPKADRTVRCGREDERRRVLIDVAGWGTSNLLQHGALRVEHGDLDGGGIHRHGTTSTRRFGGADHCD